MSVEQREAFLADVHIGVLAIEHAGHGPLAVPIWYLFEDGAVQILMDGGSLKAKLLRAAGRATLTVQRETPPYQYVSVEGPVVVESGNGVRLKMATRYLGEKAGREYADGPNSPDAVVVTLTPAKWRSVDYGG
jgi:hypothetical protein